MKSLQGLLNRELISLRKPWAFLLKDFINETSYKFSFIIQFLGIFFTVLVFFFLSKLFGNAVSPLLKPYGGDYFSFVLIGIAFANYLQVSLRSFSSCIRDAQILGTLEALLVTQTSIPTIIFSSSLYSFVLASLRVIVFLLIGVLALGLNIGDANFMGAILILLLTIFSFSSLGIISASFIMVLKRGDPLSWIFTSMSWLLGGVYYPITVLPDWVQKFSYLLPITYSLEGMRLALLKGYTLRALLPSIIPLLIFTIIMLPVSMWVFKYAVKRAKVDGSLIKY
ncbi:MAG: ABC transporter permease [Thermodesulfobacteriota bacterium]